MMGGAGLLNIHTGQLPVLPVSPMKVARLPYSTLGFIETLRPEKQGLLTRLIDPISGAAYGWIFELWPVTLLRIKGWRGERILGFKFFEWESVWWQIEWSAFA
jgi:hypothetical protein